MQHSSVITYTKNNLNRLQEQCKSKSNRWKDLVDYFKHIFSGLALYPIFGGMQKLNFGWSFNTLLEISFHIFCLPNLVSTVFFSLQWLSDDPMKWLLFLCRFSMINSRLEEIWFNTNFCLLDFSFHVYVHTFSKVWAR